MDERRPAPLGSMRTELLQNTPQHSGTAACVDRSAAANAAPCYPPHNFGFDVEKYLVQTSSPGQLDTQARTKDMGYKLCTCTEENVFHLPRITGKGPIHRRRGRWNGGRVRMSCPSDAVQHRLKGETDERIKAKGRHAERHRKEPFL